MIEHRLYCDNMGNICQIITKALSAENGNEYIVYQEMHTMFRIFIKPSEFFYNEFIKYYTVQPSEGDVIDDKKDSGGSIDYVNPVLNESLNKSLNKSLDKSHYNNNDSNSTNSNNSVYKNTNKTLSNKGELPDANLMAFLDAETMRDKINILNNIRNSINENTISSIEISLDMPAGFGDIDARIDAVKRTLQTHDKFEGRRLR